ncbi:MAG: ATP-binding protein [Anaerolineae bacterium]
MPDEDNTLDQLRSRAERALSNKDDTSSHHDEQSIEDLLHEVNVYQVELEMQLEELRQANEELQATQQRYASLFDNAPVGYVVTNEQGVIRQANSTAAALLRVDSLQGDTLAIYIDPASQDAYHLLKREALSASGPVDGEVRVRRKDDQTFHARLIIHRMNNTELRTAIVDISPLKEAEESLQRSLAREKELNDLRERMLQVIAHEFRTPLTSIIVYSDLLERGSADLTEEVRSRRFQTIRNMAWYLNNLVDKVRSMHRLEEGLPELNLRTFELLAFVQPLVEDISVLNEEGQQVELEVICSESMVMVTWDQNLLRTILMNLIGNALKYSGAAVACKVECDGASVRFRITDEGAGISLKDQEHMYEAFYRGENARFIPGTGIGLYVVERAVAAHGGTIRCVSASDQGTTFIVELPQHAETDSLQLN